MSRILTPLALLLATAASPVSARDAPPIREGQYRGTPCPKGDQACMSTGRADRLTIAAPRNGTVGVSVKLVFAGGQTCEMSGDAAVESSGLVLTDLGLDDAKPCKLGLVAEGALVRVEDRDDLCRPVYCGAAGRLDGAVFKYFHR